MPFSEFTNKSVEETLNDLNTSKSGLSEKEVALRQKKYGLNETKERGVGVIDILKRQFKSPFFYLLFIASLISFIVGQKIDGAVILTFVALNVSIGFFQEHKAERAISLLKKFIPQKVKVLRSASGRGSGEAGKEKFIDKKYLTLGDIVLLKAGDVAPAELRLSKIQNFLVNESALTGESAPVEKKCELLLKKTEEIFNAENILFAGTQVVSGRAEGIVVSIGKNTALGKISSAISEERQKGVYEKDLFYFSRLILKIVVATIIIVFLLNLIIKGTANIFNFALFCVALIVSILPEALPAVVAFALSRGSLKLAKEKVVVRRLSAIEDLGNIEILCADKTGTLTQNKLSLSKIVSSDKNKCLLYGFLSSDADSFNPFDLAVIERVGDDIARQSKKFTTILDVPFDSFRMKSSYLVEDNKKEKILIVKGASEAILKSCIKFSGNFDRKEIKEDIEKDGLEGKRVLAIAFKKVSCDTEKISDKDEKALTFLGYFVFEDPIKSTAEDAIRLAKKLGVQIKIITGDSKEAAGYIAKKVGLIANLEDVISGEKLQKMLKEDFETACEDNFVFARISPDLKYKIIKTLEKKYDVGFIGDGINDAPALKAANVGIAVQGASDIAKESSDIVLLQKDLRVVIDGIKNGRVIFTNINKYIKCSLSSNFGNFYSIAAISLFINFLPMLPVQILLGNILSDIPLISIATDSVDIEELRKPKLYRLHMEMPLIVSLGLISMIFDFIFYIIFFKNQPAVIQTLWFIQTIFTEIFLIFIIRTRRLFFKANKPSFSLLFFTIISGLAIILIPFAKWGQKFFHFVAPPLYSIFIIFAILIAYLAVNELVKLVYYHYFKPPKVISTFLD